MVAMPCPADQMSLHTRALLSVKPDMSGVFGGNVAKSMPAAMIDGNRKLANTPEKRSE